MRKLLLFCLVMIIPIVNALAADICVVKRGAKVLYREELGEIESQNNLTIPVLDGRTIEFLAPDGSHVSKGDVVARMEIESYEETLERLNNECDSLKNDVAEKERTLDTDVEAASLNFRSSVSLLDLAKLKEEEVLARPLENDKKEAATKTSSASASLESAAQEHLSIKKLLEKGFAKKTELEESSLAESIARVSFERASESEKVVFSGATSSERFNARLAVRKAEVNVEIAKQNYEQTVARLKQSLKEARSRLENRETRIEKENRRIKRCTLYAPSDGLLTYLKVHRSEVAVGARVWSGIALLAMPDVENLKVRTQISEYDIRYIKNNSPVKIIVDTIEGKTFTGVVSWIDRWARDKNATLDSASKREMGMSGVRVFNVEVNINEIDKRLRLGFQARVLFPTASFKDVIYIPVTAIKRDVNGVYVRVKEGLGVKERRVEVIDTDDTYAIIKEGLDVGEEVILE